MCARAVMICMYVCVCVCVFFWGGTGGVNNHANLRARARDRPGRAPAVAWPLCSRTGQLATVPGGHSPAASGDRETLRSVSILSNVGRSNGMYANGRVGARSSGWVRGWLGECAHARVWRLQHSALVLLQETSLFIPTIWASQKRDLDDNMTN